MHARPAAAPSRRAKSTGQGRLVVIGGDAAGMAAAAQARRYRPELEIVALEMGRWTSYSACGIPYLVGGEVVGIDSLVARTPQTFRDELSIDVRIRHEALAIDLGARSVQIRDHGHGRTYRLSFDHLHIATGSTPWRPPIPGIDLPHVHGVQTLGDAAALVAYAQEAVAAPVVVIGGGYVGLELAEAFVKRGRPVTVIDHAPQVMGSLDPDMGALVSAAMREHGITVHTGEAVTVIEPDAVTTSARRIPAGLVVLGLGVTPNSGLAKEAGIATGARGAIRVDQSQRTSAEGVWAAGDCCEAFHLVSRKPVFVPLGTTANKQGRVAGINIGGGYAAFRGIVGTAITRLCSLEIGRTGLNEAEAAQAGLAFTVARIDSTTRSGYYPGTGPITVKLLAERGSGRVLGGQIVGGEGSAKRIDVLATAVTAGLTAEEVIGLDLGYAPSLSPLWDPVQTAARAAVRAARLSR